MKKNHTNVYQIAVVYKLEHMIQLIIIVTQLVHLQFLINKHKENNVLKTTNVMLIN